MLVLHAHWVMPRSIKESGGVLFWAEDSSMEPPAWHHGRLPQKPKVKAHPYLASTEVLKKVLRRSAARGFSTLSLPTTRSGPLPSTHLIHPWTLDRQSPFLAPWTISGLWMLPAEALPLLLELPSLEKRGRAGQFDDDVVLADDAQYWRIAASVAIESLAAQKIVPIMIPGETAGGQQANRRQQADKRRGRPRGRSGGPLREEMFDLFARWQLVLDSPRDAQRIGFLERAMPPVCRAETREGRQTLPNPRELLFGFLNNLSDSLARQWGWGEMRRFSLIENKPQNRWLLALFQEDPRIKGTAAQLQSLDSAFHAWIRHLHISGDAAFRIAFRIEPPGPEASAEPEAPGWRLHYLLQARDDPSLLISAEAVWKISNGGMTLLGRRFEQPQEKLLAGLGYAGRLFPPIAASLKTRNPTSMELDTRQAYSFLREIAPMLEESGFGLITPPWWNRPGGRLGMRLRMKPTQQMDREAVMRGKINFDRLVEYRWELSLGDTTLTEQEFRALAAQKTPLVQVRGQWVQLDPEQVEAAIRFWEQQQVQGQIGLLEAIQMGMNAGETSGALPVDEVIAEDWLLEWMERFNEPGRLTELQQPTSLQGELRPYQRYGYSWLSFFRQWGLGVCLADDMGLGKTIQAIALLLREKEILGRFPSPALLVCPTSVVTNWDREVQKFAPALKTYIHQGPNRQRGDDFRKAIASCDIVLTSYTLVRQDADFITPVKWHAVIVDEAQNIKNPTARQTQVVRKLDAGFRLAMTGTPVENRLTDLWSIMHFLNPGYLGTREAFRSAYALPIERYNSQEATAKLKKMVNPFILRRVKTDPTVITDLPEKVETKVYCTLTEEQATLYQAVVEDALKEVDESSGIDRRGRVLGMLMQLKQVCNHPAQFMHQIEGHSAQLPAAEQVNRSGKLERLIEMLEEVLAEGDRALIFSQFAEMGEMLSRVLPEVLNIQTLFLHGGVPARQRDGMITRFQDEPNGPPIFILSLKAGGTGLNLTRASHVFHFDRWWNPAVENQATDRAFRIGQKQNVQVHKFITVGTLEEMIDDLIESKKGLADSIVGAGEGWLTELSTDDLRELVQLRK